MPEAEEMLSYREKQEDQEKKLLNGRVCGLHAEIHERGSDQHGVDDRDYYSILARYTESAEKIDAFDESELTNAELAYYLEVTNRVSQKLLRVAR
jgi:hypothetical protein